MLLSGLSKVDHQIAEADSLVRRFALGEQIPIHQVTIALEHARLSLELAMQVRSRLLEGYREIMNMQL
jgi:flagellar hook-basal body complex protein FliE